jgi:hypothetical protein
VVSLPLFSSSTYAISVNEVRRLKIPNGYRVDHRK